MGIQDIVCIGLIIHPRHPPPPPPHFVIVATERFSHDTYTIKPRDILPRIHVCQKMCVLGHPNISLPIQLKGK